MPPPTWTVFAPEYDFVALANARFAEPHSQTARGLCGLTISALLDAKAVVIDQKKIRGGPRSPRRNRAACRASSAAIMTRA